MRKRKYLLFILILFISIGFAVLTSNLSIIGTASFADASFDVHFENANVEDKNIDDGSITIGNDTISITSTGTFEKPGDYINTSFYVMNSGTMDAQLNTVTISGLTNELKNYFSYTLAYDIGGSNVVRGDVLRAGQGRKINLHIEYKYDVDQLSTANNLNITTTLNYINPKKAITSTVWDYEYTGNIQYLVVPKKGNYKLEVWGASGGGLDNNYLGYGGYSKGTINLNNNQKLYIYVGGAGTTIVENPSLTSSKIPGGWNGGGSGYLSKEHSTYKTGSGGGSTDIRTIRADVTYQNNSYYTDDTTSLNSRIIVAGGGGGQGHGTSNNFPSNGAHGGGYIGNNVTSTWNDSHTHPQGGTQSSTTFGYGASPVMTTTTNHLDTGNFQTFCSGGAGGGYYGGEASIYQGCRNFGGAGGSGYIGNTNLTDKIMYCYQCQESSSEPDETNIKTRSTTNVSDTATSNYAKIGNGYARITFLG